MSDLERLTDRLKIVEQMPHTDIPTLFMPAEMYELIWLQYTEIDRLRAENAELRAIVDAVYKLIDRFGGSGKLFDADTLREELIFDPLAALAAKQDAEGKEG